MKPYSQFRPTGCDPMGLGLPDRQDWLVAPCSTNRDADLLTRANWAAMLDDFNGAEGVTDESDAQDYEVYRFGHWGPGWFEIVLVRPDTETARRAEAIEGALSDYPVLDDSLYSDMQCDEENECWEHYAAHDFLTELANHHDIDVEELEHVDHQAAFSVWNEACQDEGWHTEWDYDGPRFNFSDSVLARVDIEALKSKGAS